MRKRTWHTVLTKEFLTEHYVKKHKSPYKISKEIGCDSKTVWDYLEKFKIDIRIYRNKGRLFGGWKGFGDIPKTYWNNLINGAKTRKIDFSITIEDAWNLYVLQQGKCALSGRDIGFEYYKSNTASIDRINPLLGYTLSNIQWLHRDVNYAKQSMNNKEFILLCNEISSHNIS